jgi:hypothetical protein
MCAITVVGNCTKYVTTVFMKIFTEQAVEIDEENTDIPIEFNYF